MNGCVQHALDGAVMTITLNRPACRNAVDGPTALALRTAFEAFEADDSARVAVFTGAGGHFCAGADLAALGDPALRNAVEPSGTAPGPMGPTRMAFAKPVIAAIEGYAVAGGLELALMCDLRVAARGATFGVFCRRWGVPLVDGGTVRLPRVVGEGRALDLILTGRPVRADEAYAMGLANRVVPRGGSRPAAEALAAELAALPQRCLRSDRSLARGQWGRSPAEALAVEFAGGREVLASGESAAGAARFVGGAGRGGTPAQ